MSMAKGSKLLQYINYRMRVTVSDGRQLVGKFLAFDRHLNLVLADTEELRRLPPKKGAKEKEDREERRTLGLILLRGEEIVCLQVEGPPPQATRGKGPGAAAGGPGVGRAAGRGVPTVPLGQAQPGLGGQARGVGAPSPAHMLPRPPSAQVAAPPVAYSQAGGSAPGTRPPISFPPPAGGPPRPGMPPPPGAPPGSRPGMGPPPPMYGSGPPRPGMLPPGGYPGGPPPQFRPPMGGMPPQMMRPPQMQPPGGRGMAPPQMMGPPRPGMPPPPGSQPGMYGGPPRPGMPPPPQ